MNGGWLLLEETEGLGRRRGLAVGKLLKVCYLPLSISLLTFCLESSLNCGGKTPVVVECCSLL